MQARKPPCIDGVNQVIVTADPAFEHRLAEPMAALIVSLSDPFSHIVAPATSDAKNILPRVAALLDCMIIPDVIAIHDQQSFDRPIYAGNAIQTVTSTDAKKS